MVKRLLFLLSGIILSSLLQAQGIEVTWICFETPFVIGYNLVPDPPANTIPFIVFILSYIDYYNIPDNHH